MTNKSIKVIQTLKDIGEEFGGRSSVHGVGYISDPHLHVCDRLLWLFLFLGGLCLAIFFNICSYNAWRDNMVVTNLRSTGRPVSQMDFPTVTICGSGLHMGNVEEALRENIMKWRQERGKTGVDTIEEDVKEYMKDAYQISSAEVNIFDIVNAMVAPHNAEATLGANGARENFVACGYEFEGNDREENEDK